MVLVDGAALALLARHLVLLLQLDDEGLQRLELRLRRLLPLEVPEHHHADVADAVVDALPVADVAALPAQAASRPHAAGGVDHVVVGDVIVPHGHLAAQHGLQLILDLGDAAVGEHAVAGVVHGDLADRPERIHVAHVGAVLRPLRARDHLAVVARGDRRRRRLVGRADDRALGIAAARHHGRLGGVGVGERRAAGARRLCLRARRRGRLRPPLRRKLALARPDAGRKLRTRAATRAATARDGLGRATRGAGGEESEARQHETAAHDLRGRQQLADRLGRGMVTRIAVRVGAWRRIGSMAGLGLHDRLPGGSIDGCRTGAGATRFRHG